MKRIIPLILVIIFCLTGCADSQPSATASASPSQTAGASSTAALPSATATAAPVEPDCPPEEINTLGAEAAYLLSGGRFAEQGGFMYYFSGGEQPGLYKQGQEESLILQDGLFDEASWLNVIGAQLYFVSGGTAYEIYTDSTGLKELFEAKALLAWEGKLYYIDADGLKSYNDADGSVLIADGEFFQLFVQFGRLFVTSKNAQYGYDLLACSDEEVEPQTVLEGCAFLLSDGQLIYAETSSGIYTIDSELALNEHNDLSFDLVPAAAAAYDGNIYYCDRRDENSIYAADLEGNRKMLFGRPADFMWVYSGRLMYESEGRIMTMTLDGKDNRLLSEGLDSDSGTPGGLSGVPALEGIGNEALTAGQSKEVTLLLDGKPLQEQGISLQQAFEGLQIVNTDNLIARLVYKEDKLFIEALEEGSTVLRIEAGEESAEYLIRVVEG